jgi:methionyl-tRNA formyltransferase
MTFTPLRLVFMGTPDFALPTFQAILNSRHAVLAAVTQPDRPRGRGKKVTPAPVKAEALARGIPVLQPSQPKQADIIENLRTLQPDIMVVAAFGQLISREVLAIPSLGSLNVHASLLPRYRGAAPINWAIMQGDDLSGVTIMWLTYKLDAGEIFLQEAIPLSLDETAGTLGPRLASMGARLLVEALDKVSQSKIIKKPQPAEGITWAPLLTKDIRRLDFSKPAVEIGRWVRGLDPQPGAYTFYQGKILKVFRPRPGRDEGALPLPGTVLQVSGKGVEIACGQGTIWLAELQLAGHKRMSAQAFARGHALENLRLG